MIFYIRQTRTHYVLTEKPHPRSNCYLFKVDSLARWAESKYKASHYFMSHKLFKKLYGNANG